MCIDCILHAVCLIVHGQVTGSRVYLAYKEVYLHLKVITFVNKII